MHYTEDCKEREKYEVSDSFSGDSMCTNSFAEAIAFAKENQMYVFNNETHTWIYDGYRDVLCMD